MQAIKAHKQAGNGRSGLWGWYVRKRKTSIDAQIRAILDLHKPDRTTPIGLRSAIFLPPPVQDHKPGIQPSAARYGQVPRRSVY